MISYEKRNENIFVSKSDSFEFIAHMHSHIELLVCTDGVLSATCKSVTRELRRGEAMIAFPNDIHSYHLTSGGTGITIIVNRCLLACFSARLSGRTYDSFCSGEGDEFAMLAEEILKEHIGDNSQEVMLGYLTVILGKAFKKLESREVCEPVDTDCFTRVFAYISDNYTANITLKDIARRFGLNYYHLSRVFSRYIGIGFIEYIHQLRVEYAKSLLLNTDKSISEVAYESGFAEQRTFNRAFKRITGQTPSGFRKAISE